MALEFPSLQADTGFRRRLLVTLVALFIFRVGYMIPLPMIQAQDFAAYPDGVSAHAVSLFSVGLRPFFAVLILVEFAKLAFPALSRWEVATPRNATRLYYLIFFAVLLLAAFQSFALVQVLEKMRMPVPCPFCVTHQLTPTGPEYIFASMLSLVAGTALTGWLIRLITLHGLGNGFWVIYAAIGLENLPLSVFRCLEQWRHGLLDIATLGVGAGFVLVAIAVLATVDIPWHEGSAKPDHRRRANVFQANETLAATIWPPVLAAIAGVALISFLTPLLTGRVSVNGQTAAALAVDALLILPFAALYRARGAAWLESGLQGERNPVWTTAFAQTAVGLGAAAILYALRLPFFINPTSIIIFVAVAVSILKPAAAGRTV